MKITLLIVGLAFAAAAQIAWAATRCTINNRNSQSIYVEVRAGDYQNCNSNPVVETRSIAAHGSIVVSYGNGVTQVCAREQLGGGWAGWHATSCPSDDNSLCYINMN
jgi:hypothetical protein